KIQWTLGQGAPEGLVVTEGVLCGIPRVAATTSFTVEARDSATPPHVATRTLSLSIAALDVPIQITSMSLPNAQRGTRYQASLSATGGAPPLAYHLTAGQLPLGVTLSQDGVISGSPGREGIFPL